MVVKMISLNYPVYQSYCLLHFLEVGQLQPMSLNSVSHCGNDSPQRGVDVALVNKPSNHEPF